MLPDEKTTCPATMHTETCRQHFEHCPKWVKIAGENPQTGEKLDKYTCIDSVMHLLLIENSGRQRGTQAAIESFRNEITEGSNKLLSLAAQSLIAKG
mgnify:CR=1 FL=1